MIVNVSIGKIRRIQSYFIQQTIHGLLPVHLYYVEILKNLIPKTGTL